VNVSFGVASDVGLVRTGNEDSFFAEEPLFVIADGMGGHVAGDIASSTAIDAIEENRNQANAEDPQTLAGLVHEANAAIWARATGDSSLQGMGTTCTLVYIDGPRAHVAHVGDSRAYRLRDGHLEQLTEDHTLVARMVKEGKIPAEEAERHPQRNIVTRVLGAASEVSVDLLAIDLNDGDRLLVCSDGLNSMVDRGDIEAVLERERDPQVAADALVELANEAGGEDNTTVLVIDVHEDARRGSASRRSQGPPPPPARVRTDRDPLARSRGRWLRPLTWTLLVIALLGGGGFAATRWALDNSWFVGVDETGKVAIYSGIPEEVGGIELREKRTTTDTALQDLPAFVRSDVAAGIKVESLEEAHEKVQDLDGLAREFARKSEPEQGGQ
jgi:serine/threonine protein phosphatase PrpC